MGALTKVMPDDEALFAAVAQGDLSKLTTPQKLSYYNRRCADLGLNPLNQPFQWLMLNGKLTLYANRQCTEELRKLNGVSIYKLEKQKMDDLYVVTAYARDKHGREDTSTGAVNLGGLKGEPAANAMMKAETKAKRRVTLSICGLGLLDEMEVETIPTARTLQLSAGDYEKKHQAIIDKAEGKVSAEPHTSADGGGVSSGDPAPEEPPSFEEEIRCSAKVIKVNHVGNGTWIELEGRDGKPWAAAIPDTEPKWADFIKDRGVQSGWTLELTVTPVKTDKGEVYKVVVIWETTPPDDLQQKLADSVVAETRKRKAKVEPMTNLEGR